MKILRVLTLVGVFLLLASSRSGATPLNLQEPVGAPDFFGDYISVNYVASNGAFEALGITDQPYNNGSVTLINADWDDYSFDLTATITSAGVLTNGSLTLMGDVTGNGPENLLTGTLMTGADGTAFGSDTNGYGRFEFLFTVTGGNTDVVKDFNGIGATGGLLLLPDFETGDLPFNGSWAADFNNNNFPDGEADTWAVPEPSSILLLLVGGGVCGVAHRATTRKRVRSSR
jgi:hypothetical protein